MEKSVFQVEELTFTHPDQIANGLRTFFETNHQIEDVLSVTHIVVAVQKPQNPLLAVGQSHVPQVEYQFKFIIVYVV